MRQDVPASLAFLLPPVYQNRQLTQFLRVPVKFLQPLSAEAENDQRH